MLACVVNEMHSIRYSIVHPINWLLLRRFEFLSFPIVDGINKMIFSPFQSLITFVNKHLNKLNFEVANLNSDFKDGVYLCLLMGLLGGFFVPLYDFHLTPKDAEQMVNTRKNKSQKQISFILFETNPLFIRSSGA